MNAGTWSRDCRYFAYALEDIYVYELETGKRRKFEKWGRGEIHSISYSPDGNSIAYASSDGVIGVINLNTGKRIILEDIKRDVNMVVYSNNGKLLVSSSDGKFVRVWNLEKKKCVQSFVEHEHNEIIVSPNNTAVLSLSDDSYRLFDIQTGKLLKRVVCNADIISASFSPNGNSVLFSMADSTLRIWDANKYVVNVLRKMEEETRAMFSPDGHHIAFSTASFDGNIYYREIDEPKNQVISLEEEDVDYASLTPDGKYLIVLEKQSIHLRENVTSTDDLALRTRLNIWDENKSKLYFTIICDARVNSISYNPQNFNIALGLDDGTIQMWDIGRRKMTKKIHAHANEVECVAISSNGKFMLSSDSTFFKFWDLKTMKCIQLIEGHAEPISYMSFSPDGSMFATVSVNTIKIWNTFNRRCVRSLIGHTEYIRHLSFSPDGNQVASASNDETIRIWDVKSGKCIHVLKGTPSRVSYVKYSPNGQYLLSAYMNETVCVWDAKTGYYLQTIRQGDIGFLFSPVAFFDSKGTRLFATSSNQDLTMWDFPPLQQLIDETRERFKNRPLTPEERRKYYLE